MLVDDHAILRAGLRRLLESEPEFRVVAEAGSGEEALDLIPDVTPDLLLLDLGLPGMDGLTVIRRLASRLHAPKIVVLTMHEDLTYLEQALQAGAVGFVVKRTVDTELLHALRVVSSGGQYLHPAIASKVVNVVQATHREDSGLSRLSDREVEVLKLVALGYTNQEIADELGVSAKTVDTYRKRVMAKLGLERRSELVRFALNHRLILPGE